MKLMVLLGGMAVEKNGTLYKVTYKSEINKIIFCQKKKKKNFERVRNDYKIKLIKFQGCG